MTLTSCYPVLMSDDVAAATRWYTEHLGFEITFEAEWYVSLRRDTWELALLDPHHPTIPEAYRGSAARGVLVNLEVGDVDAVHAELTAHPDIEVVRPLQSETFGQRHFIVAAPDGVLVDVITNIEPGEEYAESFVDTAP